MKYFLVTIFFWGIIFECVADKGAIERSIGQDISDTKIATCLGCHDRGDGDKYIVLGEREGYISTALKAYRDQIWTSPVMRGIASWMSDEDINLVSSALSRRNRCDNFESAELEDDVLIHALTKVQLCEACHSERSSSNPALHGQSKAFMIDALKHFRSKNWYSPNMNPVAEGLSDRDIEVLASYYSNNCE